ncbi:MAG: DUF1549 domain-containing protein [Pirellulaceae bacterium]
MSQRVGTRVAMLLCVICLLPVLQLAAEEPVRSQFVTDVVPVLTKLGCNGGGCHGKATGQNGFKLSLLGFEPAADYQALVKEARGRRLFFSDASRSLLLQKATGRVPHGGGKRLVVGSHDYLALLRWIQQGAVPPSDQDITLTSIAVSPSQLLIQSDTTKQLKVTATFSDGTTRDATGQSLFTSNEEEIAAVSEKGVLQAQQRGGLFTVMVRFGGQIATLHGVVPLELEETERLAVTRHLVQLEKEFAASKFDQLLLKQWQRLGIAPSPEVDDLTFIRRVTIDICGSLPTPAEIKAYQADDRSDKRARLIDRLLDRSEYASYFALKWADILQNRGAGYSTNKQRPGTALFASWIRDSIALNKPYDQFVAEILTASGSQQENPPTVWYRSVRTLPNYVESVSQAFLGMRIQCAQCHHHPFERWSQADYYGLAAVFARVGRKGGFADAEVPTNEVIYLKDKGSVAHPRSGLKIAPRPLGGPDFQLDRYDDPRHSLASWMTRPTNPYFGRTMVNRLWAHFLGRGIIDPIDDARSTNPPSNPQLLDALTRDFVESQYDVKQLIRNICNSYAYRLESTTTVSNKEDLQSFARFYPRRLKAEVLLDGISQILAAPTTFAGVPAGTRAIELPDENVPAHFLTVFGRPARISACECERIDAPSLAQALEFVNSKEIQNKLTAEKGYVQQLTANKKPYAENVADIFLRIYARPPRAEELKIAVEFLQTEKETAEAYRSLLWSLLATNEFLFNH